MKGLGSVMKKWMVLPAGAVAMMLMSATPSLAQSGPFAGFAGTWSGTGTVSLSDGSNERIRCRATYNVGASGAGLQQQLRCASDSYKFELASDVVARGSAISGNWSETSRNVNGTLQGKVSPGEIEVFVEAAGFAANLTLRTTGNKQTVSISSKGEIRGVSITLTRS
ncbi:MAG: hypothetical protein A4S14_09600 [Proteobacteria bacterium SG_bin9]|nr:MAG: hypothetical protein A4S14_09600 [Proteobacteria bacterium SG_bin9]